MEWRVEFDPKAEKELDALDRQDAKRILRYLFEKIATDKNPRRFGKPLRHDLIGFWKYRIGNYRVICNIQDDKVIVLVVRLGHRKNVYSK